MDVKIEQSWKQVLKEEFEKQYFIKIADCLRSEKEQGKIIYPSGNSIFQAFALTPFENVKVVILGQDPYHGPNQAMGLSFSVKDGVEFPPSLVNIFKELVTDLGLKTPPIKGDLSPWARQGVLLLNASLTVRANEAQSHSKIGWTIFTDAVIQQLSIHRNGLIFMLWGRFAQEKASLIDTSKHLILTAAHPSPLSASKGFFGCRHFSKTNSWLEKSGNLPIDWQLP